MKTRSANTSFAWNCEFDELNQAVERQEVVTGNVPRLAEANRDIGIPEAAQTKGAKLGEISGLLDLTLCEGQVSLTLPAAVSHANFLQGVQRLAREARGRDAINSCLLERWATEEEFNDRQGRSVVIAIYGHVDGSTDKTRDEQIAFLMQQGLEMPDLPDLAIAHAAYFLTTGCDLFRGFVVRARGGALFFHSSGLCLHTPFFDGFRLGNIAAAADLRTTPVGVTFFWTHHVETTS